MEETMELIDNQLNLDKRTQYHPAFVCGLEMVLYRYRDVLQYNIEHPLTEQAQKLDILLLKKDSDLRISDPIAENFKGHTVIEYKGVGDDLDMQVLHKTIGYTSMYYALQTKQDPVEFDELTACIFRNAFPRNLFRRLSENGLCVERKQNGIYLLKLASIMYPIQIVITSELPSTPEYAPLRLLTKKPDETDVMNFLEEFGIHTEDQDYRRLAYTVAEVVYKNDPVLLKNISKGNRDMTGTIIDLVEDKVQEREQKAVDKKEKEMKAEIEKRDERIRKQDEQLQKQGEQLQKQDEQLQKQGEQLLKQQEELQKQEKENSFLKEQLEMLTEEIRKLQVAVL